MINVQPYIDKLEVLRRYMSGIIDGKTGHGIYLDMNAIQPLSPKEILDVYYQVGVLFYTPQEDSGMYRTKVITFDEYFQSQQKTRTQTN